MSGSSVQEQLHILKRVVESMKASAEKDCNPRIGSKYIDYSLHLLSEIESTCSMYEKEKNYDNEK